MNLREEFEAVKAEATAVIELAKNEKRDLTGEERQANEKRFSRLDAIQRISTDEKRLAEMKAVEFSTAVRNDVVTDTKRIELDANTTAKQTYAKQKAAVEQWIKTGATNEYAIISTTGSGMLLPKEVTPPTFVRRIFNPIYPALAAYGYQPLLTQGTDTISVPVFDDSGVNGVVTAEDAATETTGPGDPSSSTNGIQLGAKLYDSGEVWNSNTQLSAITYDLLGYLEPMLTKRIDHKQAVDWFANLVTNGTVGYTGSSASGATFADMNKFYFSLPYMYRADAVFFASDSMLQSLEGLTDTLGRPIYRTSMQADDPDTLFGKPIFTTDALAAVGADAKSMVVASAECLKVRVCENRRLVRYVNIPTHPDQVGLQQFVNADFGFVGSGVKVFQHPAS
jgi:HK97 family phage major capsid protein